MPTLRQICAAVLVIGILLWMPLAGATLALLQKAFG